MTNDDKKRLRADLMKMAEASRRFNYNPTRFLQDLANSEPDELITRYVLAKNPTDGFARLWEEKRLDLAVENIAWKSRHLFPAAIGEAAKKRLDAMGFDVENQRNK